MNPLAVPVLLMNPGDRKMSRRAPARYKSGPKKGQFKPKGTSTKRRTKRRASASSASSTTRRRTYRRRARRRRNPSLDVKGLALATVGGVAAGAANYALDGVESITNKQQAMYGLGGGAALGVLASFVSPDAGKGILAGSVALFGYKLATILIEESKQKSKNEAALSGAAFNRYMGYPYRPQMSGVGHVPQALQMSSVQADLGAVHANLGNAYQAELSAIEANLG